MLEFSYTWEYLSIRREKKEVALLDCERKILFLKKMQIDFPWEYEMDHCFLEAKKTEVLSYSLYVDGFHIGIMLEDIAQMKDYQIFSFPLDVFIAYGKNNILYGMEYVETVFFIPLWVNFEEFFEKMGISVTYRSAFELKHRMEKEQGEFVFLKKS